MDQVAWVEGGNAVLCDTWRAYGATLVIAGMSGPQNIVLARWARLVRGNEYTRIPGPDGSSVVSCRNHSRLITKLEDTPGWLHLVLVHRDALEQRTARMVAGSTIYCVEKERLDDRVRRVVEVPMRPGWGTALGIKGELVSLLDGFGREAWAINTNSNRWSKVVSDHVKGGLK